MFFARSKCTCSTFNRLDPSPVPSSQVFRIVSSSQRLGTNGPHYLRRLRRLLDHKSASCVFYWPANPRGARDGQGSRKAYRFSVSGFDHWCTKREEICENVYQT